MRLYGIKCRIFGERCHLNAPSQGPFGPERPQSGAVEGLYGEHFEWFIRTNLVG